MRFFYFLGKDELFGFSTFSNHKKKIIIKKKPKDVMNFKKKIEKKGGLKKQIHCDEVKKKKKNTG